MTCRSLLGSAFRAAFRLGSHPSADMAACEVLLCPEHERICQELKQKFPQQLILSGEGWVLSGIVLDSLGFMV